MDELRADDIQRLEPPGSVLRVMRFVEEYSVVVDRPDEERSPAIGTIGLASRRFADGLVARDASSFMLQSLKVRHGVFAQEIREFAYWLKRLFRPPESTEFVSEELALAMPGALEQAPVRRTRRRALPGRSRPPAIEEGDEREIQPIEGARPRLSKRQARRRFRAIYGEEPEQEAFSDWGFGVGARAGVLNPAILGGVAMAAGALLPPLVMGRLGGSLTPFESMEAYPIHLVPTDPISRAVLGASLLAHREAGFPRIPARDLLGGGSELPMAAQAPIRRVPSSLPMTPLLGQMTLVAPPVRVGTGQPGAKNAGATFDWKALGKGAAPLSVDQVRQLREILPEGSQALYPALPLDSLGPSAVNVPLAAETISQLMTKGYGEPDRSWVESVASLSWPTPPSQALPGALEFDAYGSDDGPSEWAFGGGSDRRSPETRGGILDFLGLPVRLAPSPELHHETRHRRVASVDLRQTAPVTVRPNVFASFRQSALPHFTTIAASPIPHPRLAPTVQPAESASVPRTILAPSASTPANPSAASPLAVGSTVAPRALSIPASQQPGMPRPAGLPPFAPMLRPHRHEPAATNPSPRRSALSGPSGKASIGTPSMPMLQAPKSAGFHAPAAPQFVGSQDAGTFRHTEPVVAHFHPETPLVQPMVVHPTHVTTHVNRPPLPLADHRPNTDQQKPIAIQASTGPSPNSAEPTGGMKSASAGPAGAASKDAEVGLLANEVWSLLKRRLVFEAQRAGHRP